MNRRTIALVIATALVALSFAAAASAQVYDEFTGQTITMMERPVTIIGIGKSLLTPGMLSAYMRLAKVEKEGMPTVYAVSIFLSGEDFLFQDKLYVKTDAGVFNVEAETKDRDVQSGGSITESSMYHITAEQLQAMATSKELKIRIVGSKGHIENVVKPKNVKKIKDWVSTHVS